jgi:predicted SAM-dependent methyltransferase
MGVKQLLNVGCGPKGGAVPREFQAYKETRLDVSKTVEPDIVASITAMPMIDDESYDAVYASHVIEHLYFHEVAQALREVLRVLKAGGSFKVQVPDLQSIGGLLALDKADATAYQGGMGPVAPLDMLYGHRGEVAKGNLYMAHKMGFTASVLKACLLRAGFDQVEVDREHKFDLTARAYKAEAKEPEPPNGEPISTSAAEASCACT